MRKNYQRKTRKSNHKFEVVGGQELLVRVPLPMAEVWAEMQAHVEELAGQAGLQILRAILENEVTQRVGPPHRPNPSAGCVRWGKQPGYVVFAGQKVPLERPRVRTREGQEVELESYTQLQQDGNLQRAVREGVVAGLSTRNYRRAVESVVEGYGIEKSSVSRQFVAASSNQLRSLCERRLEDLKLVVLMIDGIHFGGRVLVVALGIAESGGKHVLGVWQGATENTTVVTGLLEDLVDRGLDMQRRYLVVIDGSKALRAGVERVFGEQAEVQRCQVHKRRNVKEYLPENCQRDYDRRMRNAYAMSSYTDGKAALEKIFRQLERINPSAARSLGRRAGRDADGPSLGYRRSVAPETNHHQRDRIVPVDSATGGAERKTLARRRSAAALDGHRTPGSREKVPTHQRLSRNSGAEGAFEPTAHSAEGGTEPRSRLNSLEGRLTVPNIESRCNQLGSTSHICQSPRPY